MKKLFFLLLLASTFGQAQIIRFGLKAGPNFSNFSGGPSGIDYSGRTSFHAGALVQLKLTDHFAVQPEALYSSQGADVDGVGDFNLDYIAVPVLAKFYLIPTTLSVDLGPQFSFLIDDSAEVFDEVSGNSDSQSFDFAAAGGATLNVTKNLIVQARYTIGLTEASKDAEVKNSVFQFSVGWMF